MTIDTTAALTAARAARAAASDDAAFMVAYTAAWQTSDDDYLAAKATYRASREVMAEPREVEATTSN